LLQNPENFVVEQKEKRRLKNAPKLSKLEATAAYMKDDFRQFWEQRDMYLVTVFLDGWVR